MGSDKGAGRPSEGIGVTNLDGGASGGEGLDSVAGVGACAAAKVANADRTITQLKVWIVALMVDELPFPLFLSR